MNSEVQRKRQSYPADIRCVLEAIRKLILGVANNNQLGRVEESLKWGQLSYTVPTGTGIRLDWDASEPDKLCLFVHCQTKLISHFRAIYPEQFEFRGNRGLVINLEADLPLNCLAHCIELAMTYHKIKHQL